MNIRNVQQAMRSYQRQNGFEVGEPGLDKSKLIGPGLFVEQEPVCPKGGEYTWLEGKFPETGVLMLRCSHEVEHVHRPSNHSDW